MRGLRIEIEIAWSDGSRRGLWSVDFDPVREARDRGLQPFSVVLPKGATGELVLRVASLSTEHPELDWGAFAEVELR